MSNDNQPPEAEEVTGATLRERAEALYGQIGELSQSMKNMAYISGGMDAVAALASLIKHVESGNDVKPPPAQPLDVYSLKFAFMLLHQAVQQSLSHTVVTDVVICEGAAPPKGGLTTEGPPPGAKLS